MPGFFEARANFKSIKKDDNFYIVVEDKNIVALTREPDTNTVKIDRDMYKFLLDNGIDYYIYNNGIEKRPIKKVNRMFNVLMQAENGYALCEQDPFWPIETQQQGVVWQTPSE